MKKRLFSMNRMGRLMVSFLFCIGFLIPLLKALNTKNVLMPAICAASGLLLVFTVLGAMRRGRIWLALFTAVCVLVQFLLPDRGLIGSGLEALKALRLYINGVPGAVTLYSLEISICMGILLAVVFYAFSAPVTGIFPSALMTIGLLYSIWSLGRADLLWYTAPALVALLLQKALCSHQALNPLKVLPFSIGIVLLSLLLLPSGRFAIEPLYDAAMDLKQSIADYLFFTDPRDVFSIGDYGYYPNGSSKLGGPVQPSDIPVLLVKTDQRVLLRGVCKDEYTGRSWRDTSSSRRYLYVNPRWKSIREKVFNENLPSVAIRNAFPELSEKTVSVQVQNTTASTVFVPVAMRSFNSKGDMVAYFNDASELFITRNMERNDQYTITAPLPEGGGDTFASVLAAAKETDPQYERICAQYTTLPSHLESKVFEDLANIVANSPTPYEKACAIFRHLRRYYRYTLTPVDPPENQDFVTYFLYVNKEGYCTYFASAMAVLCRMAGLPTRYVEGFLAQPDANGFAYVTGKEAHAWCEVYFEGFGWVPFDPTPDHASDTDPPPQQNPPEEDPPPDEEQEPDPPDDDPESDEDPDPENDPEPDDQPPPPQFSFWFLIGLIILILLIVAWLVFRNPKWMAARQKSSENKVFIYSCACLALCESHGYLPRSSETLSAFAHRIDTRSHFKAPLMPLFQLITICRYQGVQLSEEDALLAGSTYHKLFHGTDLPRRVVLLLKAGFRKDFYHRLDQTLQHEVPASQFVDIHPPTDDKSRVKRHLIIKNSPNRKGSRHGHH